MLFKVAFHSGAYHEENCTMPVGLTVGLSGMRKRPETKMSLNAMMEEMDYMNVDNLTKIRHTARSPSKNFDLYLYIFLEAESEARAIDKVLMYFPDCEVTFAIAASKLTA